MENNMPKKNILSSQIDLKKFEPATEEEKAPIKTAKKAIKVDADDYEG